MTEQRQLRRPHTVAALHHPTIFKISKIGAGALNENARVRLASPPGVGVATKVEHLGYSMRQRAAFMRH